MTPAGALVDCTILVIAFFAARAGMIPDIAFVGLLFSMASARAVQMKHDRDRKGPPGAGGLGGSAAVCLFVCVGAALYHYACVALGDHVKA